MKLIIEEKELTPVHQFGFRESHSTVDQVHRITNIIEKALEEKKVCSAVFLDVAQAFDRVWHVGLFYKLRKLLPVQFSQLLESYLSDRYFRVKQENAYTDLRPIGAGVHREVSWDQSFMCYILVTSQSWNITQLQHLLMTQLSWQLEVPMMNQQENSNLQWIKFPGGRGYGGSN